MTIYQVDAFTQELFKVNPAGVMLLKVLHARFNGDYVEISGSVVAFFKSEFSL
ncbi:hypothetical protein Q4595_11530 [Wenyingzhuangia sp. 1_MG-2023]|nr:hypothetical protein [Wenyingzhuangia sp. 1_MG-2023]